ncbi:uncharacterized protein LOC135172704 isoform X2 [Diachasmimorpha longicaudata]|uniref:uncharacterized protein LOC135172704 isoform X2 n=1 Tax=Diachasmimorpha longicaudata TaxID=58733 RepID=UPI0030B8E656
MLMNIIVLELSVVVSLIHFAATEFLSCEVPTNFTLHTYTNGRADVYNANLNIIFDYNKLELYGYGRHKYIAVRGRNVTINFDGSYTDNYLPVGINSQPRAFKETFDEEITGNAQRVLLNDTTYLVYNCRLIFLPTNEEKSSTPMITRNGIRRLAESCLESYMCERFKNINHWEFIESSNNGKFCFPPGMPSSLPDLIARAPSESIADLGGFQDIINKVVDVTLTEVIANLDQINGSLNLPNITHEFVTGTGVFQTKGRFEATGGIFRDLRTLHRSENVGIRRIGNTFRVSCGVGLSTAQLHFTEYKIKYGIVKVAGKLDGNIAGIKLEAAASIDYSKNPCVQKIDKLKVAEFGEIEIFLTGLGPLNSIFGSILDIMINAWKSDIIQMVETELMNIIKQAIGTFNCEKYRP